MFRNEQENKEGNRSAKKVVCSRAKNSITMTCEATRTEGAQSYRNIKAITPRTPLVAPNYNKPEKIEVCENKLQLLQEYNDYVKQESRSYLERITRLQAENNQLKHQVAILLLPKIKSNQIKPLTQQIGTQISLEVESSISVAKCNMEVQCGTMHIELIGHCVQTDDMSPQMKSQTVEQSSQVYQTGIHVDTQTEQYSACLQEQIVRLTGELDMMNDRFNRMKGEYDDIFNLKLSSISIYTQSEYPLQSQFSQTELTSQNISQLQQSIADCRNIRNTCNAYLGDSCQQNIEDLLQECLLAADNRVVQMEVGFNTLKMKQKMLTQTLNRSKHHITRLMEDVRVVRGEAKAAAWQTLRQERKQTGIAAQMTHY